MVRIGVILLGAALLAGCGGGGGASSWLSDDDPPGRPSPVPTSGLLAADGLCDETQAGTAPKALDFGMTECEVANLVGPLDKLDISADDRGRRVVTMTSFAGQRPGTYRFVDGRLNSIERSPDLTPPPKQAPKPKQAARQPAR